MRGPIATFVPPGCDVTTRHISRGSLARAATHVSTQHARLPAMAGPESPSLPAVAAPREVQVAPEHYDFEVYDDLERWTSYWYQIRTALRLRPKRVLEIGSGTGVFRSYLRN